MVDGQARLDPSPDLRGGDGRREPLQNPPSERGWKRGRPLPGPRNDDKFEQLRQFLSLTPFRQLFDVVRPDEVKKAGVGELPNVIPSRINGIGNAAPPDLLLID